MSETQRMFHDLWLMRRTTSTVAYIDPDRIIPPSPDLKREGKILAIDETNRVTSSQGINKKLYPVSEVMTPKKIQKRKLI
jgi:hypothetical protein